MAAECGHPRTVTITAVIGVAAIVAGAAAVIDRPTAVIGRATIVVVVAVAGRGDRNPGADDAGKRGCRSSTSAATVIMTAPGGAEVGAPAGSGRQALARGGGSGASQRRLDHGQGQPCNRRHDGSAANR